MTPKLFIASGIYPPESGGPATYLNEILPQLHERQWQIRVLTYADQPAPNPEPYPVTRIMRESLPIRLWRYARAARPLLEWADLVYLHTLSLPLVGSQKAPRIAKIVGDVAWERSVRRGWILPTMDIDAFQTEKTTVQAEYAKVARAREARHLSGVIVPSEYLRQMICGWGVAESSVHVIYNALPPHSAALTMTQTEARRQLDLPDAPTLLCVGRVLPWKGVDHLIAAVSAARIPDLRLVVAGDGDLIPALKAQAESLGLGSRVQFLGRVSRERIPVWMKAADYVALYSGYEGLSHTLLESLREGTPVIASDKGGNPEVVVHEQNGLLVPYVDLDALTAALEAAFIPGTRDRLAQNHAHGMDRFAFDAMVDQTERVLRSYLSSG